jgi:hypothetical protein
MSRIIYLHRRGSQFILTNDDSIQSNVKVMLDDDEREQVLSNMRMLSIGNEFNKWYEVNRQQWDLLLTYCCLDHEAAELHRNRLH